MLHLVCIKLKFPFKSTEGRSLRNNQKDGISGNWRGSLKNRRNPLLSEAPPERPSLPAGGRG